MEAAAVSELVTRFHRAEENHLCPECGDEMIEIDRMNTNGHVFLWYKCSRENCAGQWLQKKQYSPAGFAPGV